MNDSIKKCNQSKKNLDTAFDCISAKGYANTSMRDIADEAGVALSQLHYYYSNKEKLFFEVIDFALKEYITEIKKHISEGNTSKEKMKYLLKYYRETLVEKPKLFRLLYDFTSMALWNPVFAERLNMLFRDMAEIIEKEILLDSNIEIGIDKYTTEMIARIVFGAMFGTSIQVLLDPAKKDLLNALETIESIL